MPPPAPTELLAEDVRDLRESNRGIASDIKALEGGHAAIQTELATIKTELRFIKWIGGFIAALLVGLFTGAGSIIWSDSALNSKVEQLSAKSDEQRAEIKEQSRRFDKIEQQLGQMLQRLEQGKGKQ